MNQPQARAYRYRFYPTPAQAATLARTFGCARYVYNWALRLRSEAYQERQESLGYQGTSAALTSLKQQPETAWLSEVSSVPLQQALRQEMIQAQADLLGQTVDTEIRRKTDILGESQSIAIDNIGRRKAPGA